MTEKEKAELRKLNEEIKTLRHDRWLKRQELKLKLKELEIRLASVFITTLIGSAGLFKIIQSFL